MEWTELTLCEAVRLSQDHATWRLEQHCIWPQQLLIKGQKEEDMRSRLYTLGKIPTNFYLKRTHKVLKNVQ